MITLTIPDISCGHCARAVTTAIQGVDASAKVEVDVGSKRVMIESTFPLSAFTPVLIEEGYPPNPA
jgi:copper chaperone